MAAWQAVKVNIPPRQSCAFSLQRRRSLKRLCKLVLGFTLISSHHFSLKRVRNIVEKKCYSSGPSGGSVGCPRLTTAHVFPGADLHRDPVAVLLSVGGLTPDETERLRRQREDFYHDDSLRSVRVTLFTSTSTFLVLVLVFEGLLRSPKGRNLILPRIAECQTGRSCGNKAHVSESGNIFETPANEQQPQQQSRRSWRRPFRNRLWAHRLLRRRIRCRVADLVQVVLSLDESQILECAGMDAVVMLRFCALCGRFCALSVLWGLLLAPLYSVGGNWWIVGPKQGLSRYSLSNVRQGSPLLWAAVPVAYLCTLTLCGLLWREYEYFVQLRKGFLSGNLQRLGGELNHDDLGQARRTVILERIPVELRDPVALRTCLEDLLGPNAVHSVALVPSDSRHLCETLQERHKLMNTNSDLGQLVAIEERLHSRREKFGRDMASSRLAVPSVSSRAFTNGIEQNELDSGSSSVFGYIGATWPVSSQPGSATGSINPQATADFKNSDAQGPVIDNRVPDVRCISPKLSGLEGSRSPSFSAAYGGCVWDQKEATPVLQSKPYFVPHLPRTTQKDTLESGLQRISDEEPVSPGSMLVDLATRGITWPCLMIESNSEHCNDRADAGASASAGLNLNPRKASCAQPVVQGCPQAEETSTVGPTPSTCRNPMLDVLEPRVPLPCALSELGLAACLSARTSFSAVSGSLRAVASVASEVVGSGVRRARQLVPSALGTPAPPTAAATPLEAGDHPAIRPSVLQGERPRTRQFSSTAFVTLRSLQAACLACQVALDEDAVAGSALIARPAPEYRDIVWQNAAKPLGQGKVRGFVVEVALFLGLAFWSVPVSLLQAWCSLDRLQKIFPWLRIPLFSLRSDYHALITLYLPVLALLALLESLPICLHAIGKNYEGVKSWSSLQMYTMRRYWRFQLATIVVTALSSSVWDSLKTMMDHPPSVLWQLAQSLPKAAVYFFATLISSALVIGPASLLRPRALIAMGCNDVWYTFRSMCARRYRPVLSSCLGLDASEVHCSAGSPDLAADLSALLFVLLACVSYATLAPVILLAGVLFFVVRWGVLAVKYLYVHVPRFDSGGAFWYQLWDQALLALVFGNLTTLAVVALRAGYPQLPFLVPLPLLPIGFKLRAEYRFAGPSQRLSLRWARSLDAENPDFAERFDPCAYWHPALQLTEREMTA